LHGGILGGIVLSFFILWGNSKIYWCFSQ